MKAEGGTLGSVKAEVGHAFILSLADGTRLALCPGDSDAARVVGFLAHTARLPAGPVPPPEGVRCLHVVVGDGAAGPASPGGDVREASGTSVYRLEPTDVKRLRGRARSAEGCPVGVYEPLTPQKWLWGQLVRLSAAIGRETAPRGGVLLHGALAEWDPGDGQRGTGVLIGGRSGIGKTTASLRLPPLWRSRADDVTLVVRDGSGVYWAHPWPTWSRLLGDDVRHPDGHWDVEHAVPLRALFFLEQAPADRVEPIGPGQAVCRLAALADQVSRQMLLYHPIEEVAAFNLQRFENLCALAKALPAFLLHVSLDGAFWRAMEQVLHL